MTKRNTASEKNLCSRYFVHFLTIDDRGLILNEADIRLHVSGEYGETTGEKMNMAEF